MGGGHHAKSGKDAVEDNTVSPAYERLRESHVIPDVVDGIADNSTTLRVAYGKHVVDNTSELTIDETANEPEVQINGKHDTYTLFMVDPDAPSPEQPKARNFLHWMVTNIPVVDFSRGDVITPYMGPAPPKGKHRYVFLLYKQSGRVEAKAPANRAGFQPGEFAKHHGLGHEPVAATFFYASPK